MKLTCDLCGGQLMVGSGGQSASCTVCGLLYSMDRLREKLRMLPVVPEYPPVKNPVKVKITKKHPVTPSVLPEEPIQEPLIMDGPIIWEPVVEDPVVQEPIIEEPVEPIVEELVIEEPVVEEPVVEEPVVEEPIVEESVVEEPVVEEPIVEEPVVEEPVVEDPVIEEPIIEEPIVEEAVVEEPVVEEPIIEEPVVEKTVPVVSAPFKPPVSYWIPPMDPPAPPLFAMELKSVAFSTIRGTVLSGSVSRGAQIFLGRNICSVIACKPAQPQPGSYAELTISNCPSRNDLRKLAYVIGCTPELNQLSVNGRSYSGSAKAYITRILQAAFSDYQMEVTNAATARHPVVFGFHQNGQHRLTVILCHSNDYASELVLEVQNRCKDAHIPSLLFFEEFWNNREYVIGRIRKTLCG